MRRRSSSPIMSAGTLGSGRWQRFSSTRRQRTSPTRRQRRISPTRRRRHISLTAVHLSDNLNLCCGDDEEAALVLQPNDPDLGQAGGGACPSRWRCSTSDLCRFEFFFQIDFLCRSIPTDTMIFIIPTNTINNCFLSYKEYRLNPSIP
jgi:hypothetical protein